MWHNMNNMHMDLLSRHSVFLFTEVCLDVVDNGWMGELFVLS